MAKIDTIAEFFSAQIEQKKFSAGFLLSGDENEKKKEVAIRFAKTLNCEKKRSSADCDCASCHKIDSGNHPDVRWYGLDEEERSIKIEAMHELQNWLNLKPYEGRVKVFLLSRSERLTTDAQNALLKSLEEPPPNSIIILLAKKKSDLLETVVSRLQEIKVPPFEEKEIVKILMKEGVQEGEANFLARYASGNLEYARTLHQSSWFKKKNDLLKTFLGDSTTGFDALALRPRKEILESISLLLSWVRDVAIVKTGASESLLIHQDALVNLRSFSKNHSFEKTTKLYEKIESVGKALEENANAKLALANLQVDWREFLNGN